MAYDYTVFWSAEAIINLESILDYLQRRWTQREVDKFKNQLGKQLNLIISNPKLFPISDYNPRLRKAVLSKQTSIFYEVSENRINVVYIFDNRQDIQKLKNTTT